MNLSVICTMKKSVFFTPEKKAATQTPSLTIKKSYLLAEKTGKNHTFNMKITSLQLKWKFVRRKL